MTCKFVLKCIIREKWLVDNNELVKAVAETFSIKICFLSLSALLYILYIYILYISYYFILYIYIYIYIYNKIYAMKVINPFLHASCCA